MQGNELLAKNKWQHTLIRSEVNYIHIEMHAYVITLLVCKKKRLQP